MADIFRIVSRQETGERHQVVLDLADGVNYFPIAGTLAITPPPKTPVIAAAGRRYGGSREVGATHDNGTFARNLTVKGPDAQTALAKAELIVETTETQGYDIEWRPDGAPLSTFCPLRGAATWAPKYSWQQFAGSQSLEIDLQFPVAPLAEGGCCDFHEDFSSGWSTALDAALRDGGALVNLVPNPTFEQDALNSDPAGWSRYNPQSQTFSGYGVSSGWASSGTQSNHAAVASQANNSYVGMVTAATVPVKAGRSYTLAAQVNGVTVPTAGGGGIFAQIQWQDAAGASISNAQSANVGTGVNQPSVTATAPAGATQALLLVQLRNASGSAAATEMYVDQVQFGPGTAYVDGNAAGYHWSGARGNSMSVQGAGNWWNDYAWDAGTAADWSTVNVAVGSGYTAIKTRQSSATGYRLIYTARGYQFADHQATVAVIPGTLDVNFKAGVVLKRVSASTYLEAYVDNDGTNTRLRIDKVVAGARTNLQTFNASGITAGTSFFIRGRIEGHTVYAELFPGATDPPGFLSQATQVDLSATLAGGDIATFGETAVGYAGITASARSTDRLYEFRIDPWAYCFHTMPETLAMSGAIPGDAPARADLFIAPYQAYPFGLLSWRPRSAVASAPWGIVEGEVASSFDTADSPPFAIVTDANCRGGECLQVTVSGTASTRWAQWSFDPSGLVPDDYNDSAAVEVWARMKISASVVGPAYVLSSFVDVSGGQSSSSYALETPGASSWRSFARGAGGSDVYSLFRLGMVRLSPAASNVLLRLNLAVSWAAGSSGLIGVDYLILNYARRRAVSPTGKPLDSSYPYFSGPGVIGHKLIRSDLSGAAAGSNPYQLFRDSGMGGSVIEIPPGNTDFLAQFTQTVPGDPSNATSNVLSSSYSIHPRVTPRYFLARAA